MEAKIDETTKIDTLIVGFGLTAIPLIRELERSGRSYKVVASGPSIWDRLAAAGRLDFDLVSSYMSSFYSFELARSKNTESRYPTAREMHEFIKRYQVEFGANVVEDWVTEVVNQATGSRVHTRSGTVYEARNLVLATAFHRRIHQPITQFHFPSAKNRTIVLTHMGDSANLIIAKLFANNNRIILVNNGFFCLDKLITDRRGTRYALDDVEMHNIGNLSSFLYKTVLPQGQILAQSSPGACKQLYGSNLFIKHPNVLRNLDLTPSLNMRRGSPFTQDLPNGLKIIKYWPIDVYEELFGDALEDSIRTGFLLNDIAYLIDRKHVELWPQQEVFLDRENRVVQWKDEVVQYDDIIDGDQEVPNLPPIVIERAGRPSRLYQYFHRDCFMGVLPRDLRNVYMLGHTRPMTGGLNNISEMQCLLIHKLITDDTFHSEINHNLDERINTYNQEHYPSTLRTGADNLVFYGQFGERIARLLGIESRLRDCRSLEDVSIHYFFPNAACKYRRTGPYAVEGLDGVVREIHRTHRGYAISKVQLLNYCLMLATAVAALVQLWRTQIVPLPFSVLLVLLALVFVSPVLPLVNANSSRISGFTNVILAVGLGLTFWLGHPLVPLGSLAMSFFAVYVGRKLRISRGWFNDMRFKDKPEYDEFFRRYCEAFRKVFDARKPEKARDR
jgi:hypothetical protein